MEVAEEEEEGVELTGLASSPPAVWRRGGTTSCSTEPCPTSFRVASSVTQCAVNKIYHPCPCLLDHVSAVRWIFILTALPNNARTFPSTVERWNGLT